jgi:hypothetical protein
MGAVKIRNQPFEIVEIVPNKTYPPILGALYATKRADRISFEPTA